jgi:hypothetical protein
MKTAILVSDHAVLRWLERVEGYDIESLRADIARIAAIGIAHRAPVVIVGRGKVVMNEASTAVLTVLPRKAAKATEAQVTDTPLLTMAELYRLRSDRKWLRERLKATGKKRVRLVDRREIEARLRSVTTGIMKIERGLNIQ